MTKTITVRYNTKTISPYSYFAPDGLIEQDVISVAEMFNGGNSNIEIEVGNELYVYYFRIMIKRKVIKCDELKVIYIEGDNETNCTFDDHARFCNFTDIETEFEKVLKELL
jgi:hypothetical protein